MRKFLLLTLIALCTFGVANLSAVAATLFGGVEHSDVLPPANQVPEEPPAVQEAPPLAPPIQGGDGSNAMQSDTVPPDPAQFEAPKPKLRIDWYQIPKQMAGSWYKRGDYTENVTDLRTGTVVPVNRFTDDELTAHWGHQYDKAGNIWHANTMPFERDGTTNGQRVQFQIVALRAKLVAANELVSRTRSIITESQRGVVTKIFQQESINHYFVSEKKIVNESSNRDFTYEGAAVRDGRLRSEYTKVAPFQPIPTLNGVDLASSLADYLRSKGLQ